ncbi:MAG TPA: hypothetical protein VJ761_15195 [Ktedonobacteraceae bacterium]|nr:hypothetical protein [Ktedonobacteraceae bacterium]
MKRTIITLIASLLLALALVGCGVADTSTSTTTASPVATIAPPTPTPTTDITTLPAYQLASLDEQGATPDTATIAKYQKVLDSLHSKTGETEQQIADETITGQGILNKNGYTGDDRLIMLLNAVDGAITKSEHVKYDEALAALITIMLNGK